MRNSGKYNQSGPAAGRQSDLPQHRRLRGAVRCVIIPFWTSRAALRSYLASFVVLGCLVAGLLIAIANNAAFGDLADALVDRQTDAIAIALKLIGVLVLVDTLIVVLLGFLRKHPA